MSRLEIRLEGEAFEPGAEIVGEAVWDLDAPADSLRLSLLWYTVGKGDRDSEVVERRSLEHGSAAGASAFRLRLPDGPYCFSGKLISLIWAVELVAEPGEHSERREIVVAPGGREISLVVPEAVELPDAGAR